MGQASPFSHSKFEVTTRRKSARLVMAELKSRLRMRAVRDARRLTWSVNVGDLSDAELDEIVAGLAQKGYRGVYSRELGFIAHFEIEWGLSPVEHPRRSSSATAEHASAD